MTISSDLASMRPLLHQQARAVDHQRASTHAASAQLPCIANAEEFNSDIHQLDVLARSPLTRCHVGSKFGIVDDHDIADSVLQGKHATKGDR